MAAAYVPSRPPFDLRGAALGLMHSQAPEVVLGGPAGTGKSVACCLKLHMLCEMVPGVRCLMVRKTRESLTESAMVTLEERVFPPGGRHPALATGGTRRMRQSYQYPNGSVIVLGGMDKPGKVMSTEYDCVYANESIDLAEGDWGALTTRLRGGKLPYKQIIGDTNPDAPTHWLKRRADAGTLLLLESRHEDNPYLWRNGGWTPEGADYISKLDALPAVQRLRLRFGRWVQAEGVVYPEWSPGLHVVDGSGPPPPNARRVWAIDFGYTDPFACLMAWIDGDGRAHVYRQVYMTKRLVEDHAARLRAIWEAEAAELHAAHGGEYKSRLAQARPEAVVCDPEDRQARETLARHLGLPTVTARKDVKRGIQLVKARLTPAGDGRPRLTVRKGCLDEPDQSLADAGLPYSLEQEMDRYVWSKTKADYPQDEYGHGLDACRYMIAYLEGSQWEAPTSAPAAAPGPAGEGRGPSAVFTDRGRESRLFGR